jgi:hypothetical protein
MLAEAGITLHDGAAEHKLEELRQMYEPHVQRLSEYLLMSLPPWFPPSDARDTWQVTAWERFAPKKGA